MIFRFSFLLVALLSLHLSAASTLAQATRYVVTDIGTLGGDFIVPFGINNSGQVVGYSTTNGSNIMTRRGFRYSNGIMQDLGTLGGPVSIGFGINDAGQIVGNSATVPASDSPAAFLYSSGVMTNLGKLPSDLDSYAFSINNSGQVVGLSAHDGDPDPFLFTPFYRGFLYSNGVMQDLSALLGGVPSRANHINDSGQIVGSFNFGPYACGQGRAFLFSGGTMRDLGTLPDTACSEAIAINNRGEVVGVAAAANGSAPRLFYNYGNVLLDMGSLGPHLGGRPTDINNAGQIVGSFSATVQTTVAFIYSDGALTDLNTLVPANLGWELRTATGINDSGQIVCLGYRPGSLTDPHAFLLTPTMPVLLTEPNSNRAIALDSATFTRGPFSLVPIHNFSPDQRTRITLFARYAAPAPDEPASVLTAQAKDAQQKTYSLPVEYVGNVPQFGWPTQIVVGLPDELAGAGDVEVSITFRGVTSNSGIVSIKPATAYDRRPRFGDWARRNADFGSWRND